MPIDSRYVAETYIDSSHPNFFYKMEQTYKNQNPLKPNPIFDFQENEYVICGIHEYCDLHLERITKNIAYLYCKERMNNIDWKKYLYVCCCENNELVIQEHPTDESGNIKLYQGKPYYELIAGKSYEIKQKNHTACKITPEPCWEIHRQKNPPVLFEFKDDESTICNITEYSSFHIVKMDKTYLYMVHNSNIETINPDCYITVLQHEPNGKKIFIKPSLKGLIKHYELNANTKYEIHEYATNNITVLSPKPRWHVQRCWEP